ncbi:MAG TPA: hypothetical protein VI386_20245 [Candidatus Sulfotelmatobacter sp.]
MPDIQSSRPAHLREAKLQKVVAVLYFCVAGVMALHCYRNSMLDIDLLGYAGNVALNDTGSVVEAHRIVYGETLTPHLRGLDSDDLQALILRHRAVDPYYSSLYLPYFSIKPLYLIALEAVNKLGLNVVDASRALSALSYFGIAVMAWIWTRSLLSLLIIVLPEVMLLGQANEPDGLSAALLLFALWLLFSRENDWGLLPLLLTVWVRPENLLLCLIVIGILVADKRLAIPRAAIVLLLAFGSQALISHYAYGWRDLYYHTFLGGEPGTLAKFGWRDYVRALSKGGNDVLHSSVPVFLLLGLVCFALENAGFRKVIGIAFCFSVVRFAVFPSYEPRYYALFFLITAIAAVTSYQGIPFLAPRCDK